MCISYQSILNYIFSIKLLNVYNFLDIPEEIDYYPTSGRKDLFPNAQLRLCDDPCHVKNVNAKLTLATSHIGKGCDRDTYSVQSQRKLCGKLLSQIYILINKKCPIILPFLSYSY